MVLYGLVDIYKKIKKSKGWTTYKMAKQLGISQTQLMHYESQPISTREIILTKLFSLSEMELKDFWGCLEKEAKDARKKKIKAIMDDI